MTITDTLLNQLVPPCEDTMRLAAPFGSAPPLPHRELHEALQRGPFHRALSLAIDASGLSLQRLQHRLATTGTQLSKSTLSYWRTGRSRPERASSLRALAVLESALGLASGALSALLDTPRPPRRQPRARRPKSLWANAPAAVSLLAEVGMRTEERLFRLSLHETVQVGVDGVQHGVHVREVVRATHGPVDLAYALLYGQPGGDPPELVMTRHCSPVEVRSLPEQCLTVCELALDRVIAQGETAIIEYQFAFRDTAQDLRYERRFSYPVHEHLLEVQFDPGAVPAACSSYRRDALDSAERDLRPLTASPSGSVHLAQAPVPAGVYGICWHWD
ncbi:hypothetical protein [Kutzneria albida]|uniref:hypothetical protein n=1 Tax=Kutzneria albida TaxID=43357 RepID=UPI00046D30A7|nr:hypothetical protein [Kutzneria albida]